MATVIKLSMGAGDDERPGALPRRQRADGV